MRNSEQGIALIAAMLLLTVLSLVAAMMAHHSFILWQRANIETRTSLSLLELESAAARGLWLLLDDIAKNPLREPLDELDYSAEERFAGDNCAHYLKIPGAEYDFELRILDARTGYAPTSANAAELMELIADAVKDSVERRERAHAVLNRVLDFNDQDVTARDNSLENPGYRLLGHPALPEGSPAGLPEIYALVPGFLEFIPPDRYGSLRHFNRLGVGGDKPNIFSAPRELVYLLGEVKANERKYIDEAFDNIYAHRRKLELSLDMVNSSVRELLMQAFTLEESGYFLIIVKPMLESRARGRSLELLVSFEFDGDKELDYTTLQILSLKTL